MQLSCLFSPESQIRLSQHLAHVGDKQVDVVAGVGLAGHGCHLGGHVGLQRLEAVQGLGVVAGQVVRHLVAWHHRSACGTNHR